MTIGWGRCLDERGVNFNEASLMFDNDYNQCISDLSEFPWYGDLPNNIQAALINMCFNMGIGRLLSFKKMIAAIKAEDYTRAAIEALDSKWASQVGDRANDVAVMMREGNHGP